jgi:hypothetical protein
MKAKPLLLAILAAATITNAPAPAEAQQTPRARVVEDPSDVMGGAMPKFPVFPKIAKKPGHIRGWVKDVKGKPLKGARIEIGSTAIGGAKLTYRLALTRRDCTRSYCRVAPATLRARATSSRSAGCGPTYRCTR